MSDDEFEPLSDVSLAVVISAKVTRLPVSDNRSISPETHLRTSIGV